VWALTPRQSIERECDHRGRADVVAGCAQLITGQDVDAALLLALGGPAAAKFHDGEEHADTYWLRVRQGARAGRQRQSRATSAV